MTGVFDVLSRHTILVLYVLKMDILIEEKTHFPSLLVTLEIGKRVELGSTMKSVGTVRRIKQQQQQQF